MLENKVVQLEQDVVTAQRIASFWRKQIDLYGEPKAEAFYRSLGLNHLETKSIEWEGLKLSREPNEVEKSCVKGIAQAQESGKESIAKVLLSARLSLIDSALSAIKKLTPATYHELILTMPEKFHDELREQLIKIFGKGKLLVARELEQQSGKRASGIQIKQTADDDELDGIIDLTDARVANEVQSRIAAAASRFALLGLTGKALWDAVSKEVGDGSTGWLDRIATGATNKVLSFGRAREMKDRQGDIDRYEQSELLDDRTCPACAEDDGKTASDPEDLPGAPNPDCEGSDYCRGFIVAIAI